MIKCMTWVCDYNNGNECCHEKGTCDCRIIPESEQAATAPVDSRSAGSVSASTVKTDPVLEAIARKLAGINGVPLLEQGKMIKRAAKAGAEALRKQNAEISGE